MGTMEQETMGKKNRWGQLPMPKVIRSPYDGIKCAENDDDWFDEIKDTILASISDPSINYAYAVNKRITLQNARLEIFKSGILFSMNWLEGRTRGKDFSTIVSAPKLG